MADRILLVLSDIEIGAGGLVDDFPHDELVREVLEGYAAEPGRVDLVLNGDILDFMRTSADGAFPSHVTSKVACEKLHAIAAAHAGFFAALRSFLDRPDRFVHFVIGNHDAELLFPGVQATIAELCGSADHVRFPGFFLRVGPVHIEHGSQLDPMFAMEPDRPFVGDPEDPILNLPWGTLALSSIWGLLKQDLFALDRIKPRARLFELIPDARRLMLRQSWNYFSREFPRGYRADPLKHVTWSMLKEVLYRFWTADADVAIRNRYLAALKASTARLYVIGHEHRAARLSIGGKTLFVCGCMRNEYRIDPKDDVPRPVPKGAVEIRLREGRIHHARALTFPAPEPPPGHVPRDVHEMLPTIRRYLDQLEHPPEE
jgi:UDP-2,3-diacylglucosamine pyrophosphatase LpxH